MSRQFRSMERYSPNKTNQKLPPIRHTPKAFSMLDWEKKARVSNCVFYPTAFTSKEWTASVMRSTAHADYGPQGHFKGFLGKEFNLKKTPISEYANARSNCYVFVNPRFGSC